MPHRNRVAPTGEIFADPARGDIMGNRGGVIHNDAQEIVRPYAGRRWLICVLQFKGRRRVVMSPRRYTELFFLDEAVALAAGHRPCAECRRDRFNAFRQAWRKAHASPEASLASPAPLPSADEMDLMLHPARIDRKKSKVTWSAPLASLPDGTFVLFNDAPHLVLGSFLHRWTPARYTERQPRPDYAEVPVLTPQPTVNCLAHGYRPDIHSSATQCPT
jgi:hypothetical protein